MSLLAKCEQCGSTIAKGTTCPNCFAGGSASAAQQDSCVEEYQRRKAIHKRNYAIFMSAALALGLTTILIVLAVFMVTKGYRLAGLGTPITVSPKFNVDDLNPGDPGDPDDFNPDNPPEDDPGAMEMESPVAPLTPDDIDYSHTLVWLIVLVGLMVAEGGLTFFVLRCRQWWPIELLCPACNERLDELGGDPERCPSCVARLR